MRSISYRCDKVRGLVDVQEEEKEEGRSDAGKGGRRARVRGGRLKGKSAGEELRFHQLGNEQGRREVWAFATVWMD
eukprot:6193442-Pleurochrysis_carterae.AAC.1